MHKICNKSLPQFCYKANQSHWSTIKDVNQNVIDAQYAVRGKIPTAAAKIQAELNKMKQSNGKNDKYPFDAITELNIGNPQSFGQPPISFNREVLALLVYPELHKSSSMSVDAKRRAQQYQDNISHSLGAYSASQGYSLVREQIASFIQKRDGTKLRPSIDNIMLTDGASQGIHLCMNALLKSNKEGVMIPIPQYPLYSASIALNGAQQIPYYLDESKGWQVSNEELESQYKKAVEQGIHPKIMVVINPGNPTGQVLDRKSIEDIVKFCATKKIILFADEVYQKNVYASNKKFYSMRQVREELPAPYNQGELFSFHSISKGISGECGFRGGYTEISQIDSEVFEQIQKAKTIMLCSNTPGQILTGLQVAPPTKEEGFSDETVEKYTKECEDLFQSIKKRSEIVSEALLSIKGIHTNQIEGAMYAFPTLDLSDKFIKHALTQGFQQPDEFYCMQVLENTGLVFVPGSGFQQKPGTYHFRTTTLILPEEKLISKMKILKNWHEKYMTQF